MKLLLLIPCILFCACVEHNEIYETPDAETCDQSFQISKVEAQKSIVIPDLGVELDACVETWMCWNTNSKLHNKPCQPECMERGNNHTFCYLVECE